MMRTAWLGAVFAALGVVAGANAQDSLLGAPQPDKTVRDRDFGVVARHLGLERRVEMLQWQATPDGYTRQWSAQPVDDAAFSPGHDNPGDFPLQSRRWVAEQITVDGKPLDVDVIRYFGQWRDFRPGFSSLPGNLAATFQPEGDGLGSAENPLAPRIGDLRIHWRELVLPPLEGRVALRDGRWQLIAAQTVAAAPHTQASEPTSASPESRRTPWLFGGAFIALLAAAMAARRRRRNR